MQEESGSPARDASPAALSRRLTALRELFAQVDDAHDRERQELARELHHKVVGALSALKMECDWLLRPQRADESIRPRLQRLSEELGSTIDFTRSLIHDLWPAIVGHLGLSSALEQQIADVRQRTGATIEITIEGDVDDIPEVRAILIYRLVQEVMAECEGDAARLREVSLRLQRTDSGLALHIELDAVPAADRTWLVEQERIARIGGQLKTGLDQRGRYCIDAQVPADV